ncbi:MAG TPA: hypothetical protein DCS39_06785 [Rhodobiaceae bacterium]|nr:hypothetical protein [Rhodobiaceae bacterium]|tara:strand:- start:228 stop:593 length:366 start_codon:yes stop_codon:yes gene_type:complete
MDFYLLWVAALLCFASVYVHGVWGRRLYTGFMGASNLPEREKAVSYVSWDVFTVMLAVSGAALVYVVYNPSALIIVYPIMAMHLGGAGVFVHLMARGHRALLRLPGAFLMGGTGLLILLAL